MFTRRNRYGRSSYIIQWPGFLRDNAQGCPAGHPDRHFYLRADQPGAEWKIIAPRSQDHEYDVDHAGDLFYIRTNDKVAENYGITLIASAKGKKFDVYTNDWRVTSS